MNLKNSGKILWSFSYFRILAEINIDRTLSVYTIKDDDYTIFCESESDAYKCQF